MKVLSSIERLDLAAWVQSKAGRISNARVGLTFLTLLGIVRAIDSQIASHEILLVLGMAAAGVIATVLVWMDWRYRVYPLALWCFAFVAVFALSHDHPHSHT